LGFVYEGGRNLFIFTDASYFTYEFGRASLEEDYPINLDDRKTNVLNDVDF
jgi:hypothetical protein